MSNNKKAFYGWQWSCRRFSDELHEITLSAPRGSYLNPLNNAHSIVRYVARADQLPHELIFMRCFMEVYFG